MGAKLEDSRVLHIHWMFLPNQKSQMTEPVAALINAHNIDIAVLLFRRECRVRILGFVVVTYLGDDYKNIWRYSEEGVI